MRPGAYQKPARPAGADLWLDGNEGPLPTLLTEVDLESLRRYPDASGLEARLAARHGVQPAQVIVTAGADEALDRLCRAFLGPGRTLVLATPTFEMIERYAGLAGATLRRVPWERGPFPREQVLERVDESTALVTVVSPNNPTGGALGTDELRRLSKGLGEVPLVLDAAYGEYDEDDPTSAALDLPRTVVVRTLSKAWGLAGLRIGYAVASAPVVERLRACGGPYPVAGPSLALAERRLDQGGEELERHVRRVRFERTRLAGALRGLGVEAGDSRANFVLARTPRAAWLHAALGSLGIAVRRFEDRPGLEQALRITCPGGDRDFERLERGLEAALAPRALIFDLDGVLADVSRSYRTAIVETAASFGVELAPDAVRAAKAAGHANDDWSLTWRLVTAAGVDATLEEVTRRFELRYQGDGTRPGLRELERALEPQVLARLAERLPLAVVTGRPRRDAERFLEEQDLAGLVSALVAREDAALKPDPAPVRAALERLGRRSAWMVGDTPDDLAAARAAGVVALGIVAPGDPPQQAGVLEGAGAARVLTCLAELEDLLS